MDAPLEFADDDTVRMERPEPAPPPPPKPPEKKPGRLISLDAYRGAIMLVLTSSAFGLAAAAKKFPDSEVWEFVRYQFSHVPWEGCAFWDLIQPSFMFMVGVAMPFSFASRRARGEGGLRLFGHVLKRSLVLIALGVFLSSNWSRQTNFAFVNVLTQIGLAYTFAYLVVGRGLVLQSLAVLVILGGTWYAFYQHPLPPPDFDYAAVGVPEDWEHFTGLFAHWNKNANLATDVDLWFLNLFPRPEPFVFNRGGYHTLNFVPSIATLIFGVMAGELLRRSLSPKQKLGILAVAGVTCLVAGAVLGAMVCPIVKRIWTPSWVIYSTGWTVLFLAAFYAVVDVGGYRRWTFPLVVVGMNPLTIYMLWQLSKPWIKKTLQIHLGAGIFTGTYGPIVEAVAVLFCLWLFCLWLYHRRFFIRV
jgi:predicted acyltransferase